MSCSGCGRDVRIMAGGMCSACYSRQRRRGTLERKNVQNMGRRCSAPDCDRQAFSRGLCTLHYYRADHPMKAMWKVLRSKYPSQYPPEWDDFGTFVEQVGERPSEKHQLRRLNRRAPYSKENVFWLEPVDASEQDNWSRDNRKDYARKWMLKNKYGVSIQVYNKMLRDQGGLCACCKKQETFVNKRSGKIQDLTVDHDHDTGAVRGLLCVCCNRGIGYLQDDPAITEAATTYLRRHRAPKLACVGGAES